MAKSDRRLDQSADIIAALTRDGPGSTAEIARRLGLETRTLSNRMRPLLNERVVRRHNVPKSGWQGGHHSIWSLREPPAS